MLCCNEDHEYVICKELIGASPKATLGEKEVQASTKQVRRGMKVYFVQLGSRYIRNVAIGIVPWVLKQTVQQGVATDTPQVSRKAT